MLDLTELIKRTEGLIWKFCLKILGKFFLLISSFLMTKFARFVLRRLPKREPKRFVRFEKVKKKLNFKTRNQTETPEKNH